jgi:hypothetical protein
LKLSKDAKNDAQLDWISKFGTANEMRKLLIFIFIQLIGLVSIFAGSGSGPHNYHTSLTRLDYNDSDKIIEITIQLFTHDLRPVLSKRLNKSIDLEETADIDKILLEYLQENFILTNTDQEIQELAWVGKEIRVDAAFVFLEIPFEGNLNRLSLQNTIFFESFAEQTNIVVAHFNDSKADVLFKVGDRKKELKLIKN